MSVATPATPFLSQLSGQLPDALERVSVPAYVLDRSGRVRWINGAAQREFGDVTGRFFTSVLDPADAPAAKAEFAKKLRGGPATEFELDLVPPGRERLRVEISSVSLRTPHHVIGVFGIVRPEPRRKDRKPKLDGRLTPRQREVLELLGDGASTDHIAEELGVTRHTVRNHIREILRRLGARSRLEAVALAHDEGLL